MVGIVLPIQDELEKYPEVDGFALQTHTLRYWIRKLKTGEPLRVTEGYIKAAINLQEIFRNAELWESGKTVSTE